MDATDLIRHLGLIPHPEGGHYREMYRDQPRAGGRGQLTTICYLLQAGERSAWHRVTDALEVWNFHAGAPLVLTLSADGRSVATHRLGPDVAVGELPQVTVPAGCWQAAQSLGAWTLVGCAVAPAFSFAGFEMAPPGWHPGQRRG
ncbi:MAG: cupin domain-containing protein [Proteobacteria bacterium]|nr:cupin domain-containing protein [Pseudomonadota bacterium]MBI3496137.1 cupin domain-containing protein [Pseudomonadota bacterium]